jgi:uracil-DNA glycosylase family 4
VEQLSKSIKACEMCHLHLGCKAPVAGSGDPKARILLVGEYSSPYDDRSGVPFSGGPAAQVLWNTLEKRTGLTQGDVWVTNLVKCTPPLRELEKGEKTRRPLKSEIEACADWLTAEIYTLMPDLVVALGDTACEELIPGFQSLRIQHGKVWPGNRMVNVFACTSPQMAALSADALTSFHLDMKALREVLEGGLIKPVVDLAGEPSYLTCGVLPPRFSGMGPIAIDTEAATDDESGDRLGNVPWSAQFSERYNTAWWVTPDVVTALRGLTHTDLIIHNAMYDIPMLKKMGLDLTHSPYVQDSMIAAQILQTEPAGLKALALRHCGMKMRDYTEVVQPAQERLATDYLCKVVSQGAALGFKQKKTFLVQDPETGEEKPYNPQNPVRAALGLLKSMDKDPTVDPIARWGEVARKDEVEAVLGRMPQASLADVPFREALHYSCRDADASLRVWPFLKAELERMELWDVYRMDMDALPLTLMMEEAGMGISLELLDEAEALFLQELETLNGYIDEVVGRPINPASPKQVAWLLFEKLKFPKNKKRGKETSTNDKLIEMHKNRHPVVGWIQSWREAKKLLSSYIYPIRAKVKKARDGRLHARLKQVGTPTGRMTANDPNVLAIPARSAWGKKIKKAFVARPDCVIVNADFSQVELRIFAHETQEPSLIQDYLVGSDLHRRTAALMYGVPQEKVTDEQRSHGKTVNFGVIYGIGPQGLAVQLGCTEQKAAQFIENYFAGYTKVRKWMDRVESECKRNGFVRDLWGRIRHLGGIYSTDRGIYSEAVRQACNAKIQSAASGMIKKAMKDIIAVVLEYRAKGFVCDPWVQVHDALVFEVSEPIVVEFSIRLKQVMEAVRKLAVPVKADVSYGPSWGDQTTKVEG